MKITTIEQVLQLAERLNKDLPENTRLKIEVNGIESDDDIKKIATLQNSRWHKPAQELPYFWCNVKLGSIDFEINGVKKEIELKFI